MLRGAPEIRVQVYPGLIFTCDAIIISDSICQNGCTVHYITLSARYVNDYKVTHGCYCKSKLTHKKQSLCIR